MLVLAVPYLVVLPDGLPVPEPVDRIGDRRDARYRKRLPDVDGRVAKIYDLIDIAYVAFATCR